MTKVNWDRFQRAVELRDGGAVAQALEQIREIQQSASEPDEVAALVLNEVVCLNLLGRKEEAWSRLRHLRVTLPESEQVTPRAGFLEVCFLYESRLYQEALNETERLFRKFGETIERHENRDLYEDLLAYRGMLLIEVNRSNEAKPILEEAVVFPKYHGRIEHFLGVCYYRLGALQDAKKRLIEGFQLGFPPELVAASHYYLGLTHFHLGAFAWARQELEEALRTAGDDLQVTKFAQDWLARTSLAIQGPPRES